MCVSKVCFLLLLAPSFFYPCRPLSGRLSRFWWISAEPDYPGGTCPGLYVCVPQGDNRSDRFWGGELPREEVSSVLTWITSSFSSFALVLSVRLELTCWLLSSSSRRFPACSGKFLLCLLSSPADRWRSGGPPGGTQRFLVTSLTGNQKLVGWCAPPLQT